MQAATIKHRIIIVISNIGISFFWRFHRLFWKKCLNDRQSPMTKQLVVEMKS
jgi:hypothetical protein